MHYVYVWHPAPIIKFNSDNSAQCQLGPQLPNLIPTNNISGHAVLVLKDTLKVHAGIPSLS